VTSFINVRYGNVAVEIIPQRTAFCYSFAVGKKNLAQMPFSLKCVHIVTSILRYQRYVVLFGVKSLSMVTAVFVFEEEPGRRVVSTTDATVAAVDSFMRSDRRVMG